MAHVGFKALSAMLAAKGAHNPDALAAYIGRKKYTAAGMAAKAAAARVKHKVLHHGRGDSSSRAALHIGVERRIYPAQFEVRAAQDGTGGTRYNLSGYASVYDRPYRMVDKFGEYEERVRPGSGKKTLSENPDVVLVLNHAGMPMARTKNGSLQLSDDSTGLHFDAPNLNGERQTVREVAQAVEEGILDEASFAFKTTRQQWSDDYARRDIAEYSLHRGDVSVVTFGANPTTHVALRAEDYDLMDEDAARVLYERLSRRFQAPPSAALPRRLAEALAIVQDQK